MISQSLRDSAAFSHCNCAASSGSSELRAKTQRSSNTTAASKTESQV